MVDRSTWKATTHDWSRDVDGDHLRALREDLGTGELAGGIRHLTLEVLAYAHDEAVASHRRGTVVLTRHPDGSVSVDDDGRGTDTRTDDKGTVIRKPVMATADLRFRDPASAPVLPDGLPRRGMSSVAALSEWLVHENHRPDGAWAAMYRYGIPESDVRAVPSRGYSGTIVTFRADIEGPDWVSADDVAAFPHLTIRVT